jgi:hypothetical protein
LKNPISEKQLAANRANAANSTGPRTAQGKSRSAQNSRKHGFAGLEFAVVRFEDSQAVANLRADLVACYHPANSQELFAIERIAIAQHSLLRCSRLEAGLFTSCLNEALNPWGDPVRPIDDLLIRKDLGATPVQNRNYAVGEGFRLSVKEEDTWKVFLRYQAQTERQYRRAIEEFERLKALRGDLPNEPIFDPQPEVNQATSPDSERTHSDPVPTSGPPAPPDSPLPTSNDFPNEPILDPQPEVKEAASPDFERTHSAPVPDSGPPAPPNSPLPASNRISDPHDLPAEPPDQSEPVEAPPALAAVPQIGLLVTAIPAANSPTRRPTRT